MKHFAINTANFSISTLVLQKRHRFKHKRRFFQVKKHKIRSKSYLTQILSYDTFEMQKNASREYDTREMSDRMIDFYNECSKYLPPVLMQARRRL